MKRVFWFLALGTSLLVACSQNEPTLPVLGPFERVDGEKVYAPVRAFELLNQDGDTIRQKTLRSEHWWLDNETREAPVAEFFGLYELRRRAKKAVAAREKARRRLAMAGVSRRVKAPVSFRIVKRKLPLVEEVIPSSGTQSQDSVIFRV